MPLCARQPTASPQTTMPVRLTTPISSSAVVCPNGTAVRAIGMERNRSMTPLAMSSVIAVPVTIRPVIVVIANSPGIR